MELNVSLKQYKNQKSTESEKSQVINNKEYNKKYNLYYSPKSFIKFSKKKFPKTINLLIC
jgi:hypothetical protein